MLLPQRRRRFCHSNADGPLSGPCHHQPSSSACPDDACAAPLRDISDRHGSAHGTAIGPPARRSACGMARDSESRCRVRQPRRPWPSGSVRPPAPSRRHLSHFTLPGPRPGPGAGRLPACAVTRAGDLAAQQRYCACCSAIAAYGLRLAGGEASGRASAAQVVVLALSACREARPKPGATTAARAFLLVPCCGFRSGAVLG